MRVMLTMFEEGFQKSRKLHYQLKRIGPLTGTTPQGRPQPNQVEISEAQEDRVESTGPTQLTSENTTPIVGSPVRRSSQKQKPPETFAPLIRT